MLRATKVRIYPDENQAEFLRAQFGAVRFVYNKSLFIKKHFYEKKRVNLKPLSDIKPLLAVAKRSRKYHWLKDYDSIALQEAVRNLNKAYQNFFSKTTKSGFPKFKSRHGNQSSYHCTGIKVFEDSIQIPKVGLIKANIHREITGKVKSITLSLTKTGKYYASILVDDGEAMPEKIHEISKVSGIDLGLSHFAITSDGKKIDNPRFTKRAEKNLRRKQRQLSRKKKGSANRAKARLIVAKCHEKLANSRSDFQHKLSRTMIDENQAVIVETLKSANMMKNKRLSKHIADASWYSFVNKLSYKAEESGKHLIKLDQWFAGSKTCHSCKAKAEKMPLNIRHWTCPSCESENDRDINAALNHLYQGVLILKAAGLVVSAC